MFSTKYRPPLWPRKASTSMQEPHNFPTSRQDDHLRAMTADTKQELPGWVSVQHDIRPTTVTDHQGAETSKPAFDRQVRSDQEQHEKGKLRGRRRTYSLEAKVAREPDHSNLKRLEATLAEREEMLQEKEAELTRIKEMIRSREDNIRELSAANHRQNDELQQTRAELRHVNTKYQKTSQLLQERSEELSTAQQFLGKADRISPAEVVRLVEALNAEIVQQSNFILDSLTYQKWAGSPNDLEHSLKGLRGLLGPWLYDYLCRRLNDPDMEFDPLLTQLALQTGLTNGCKLIINRWYPPYQNEGLLFDRIYSEMRRKVGQVVAGKWRALSSTYLVVDREKNKERLREVLLKLITAVGSPVQSESGGHSLPPDLRSKVDDITRKALEIHKHVRSGLTSMDLEAYSIPCDTQFDTSQMEDSDGPNGRREKAGKVMCTLEIGLRYKKQVSSGKQGEFRDEMGVILKSKVVLFDALSIAFAPRITES